MRKATNLVRKELLSLLGFGKPMLVRRINRKSPPIHIYWWKDLDGGIHNFGDEVTQDIITRLFGYYVRWDTIDNCDMIGVGSLLDYAELNSGENKIKVWGSGYIDKKEYCKKDNFEYYAVRGRRTLERIDKRFSDIPLGDPGLLANIMYPKQKKDGKIGIVPHYVDLESPFIRKIKKDNRFKIISPLQAPEQVAEQISSCSIILSSSLHGIIFADSYRIPNAHISLSKKVIGGDYKFKDYCSGVGREYLSFDKKDINSIEKILELRDKYRPIKKLKSIQRRLVKTFPY